MKRIFEKILNQEINESQQRRENRQPLNEALTQKQKREVLDYIKENSFFPLVGGRCMRDICCIIIGSITGEIMASVLSIGLSILAISLLKVYQQLVEVLKLYQLIMIVI